MCWLPQLAWPLLTARKKDGKPRCKCVVNEAGAPVHLFLAQPVAVFLTLVLTQVCVWQSRHSFWSSKWQSTPGGSPQLVLREDLSLTDKIGSLKPHHQDTGMRLSSYDGPTPILNHASVLSLAFSECNFLILKTFMLYFKGCSWCSFKSYLYGVRMLGETHGFGPWDRTT